MTDIDELIKKIAEIPKLQRDIEEQVKTIKRLRELVRNFQKESGSWNTLTVVGNVNYVVHERFNIDIDTRDYQFEYLTSGEIEVGDTVYVSGEITDHRVWEDKDKVRLIIKPCIVHVISKSNSGINDSTSIY